MRITFQKALTASQSIPQPFPTKDDDELKEKRQEALRSLGELSEKLFQLREGIRLPGVELGKRKRGDEGDISTEGYWFEAGRESLRIVDE
jgi:protein AATF/BFR2